MTAARELGAEALRPKRLPRPEALPAPAFRCFRPLCGSPMSDCFHWPGLPVDRSADGATNARFAGGPKAPAAAPRAPVLPREAARMAAPAELVLKPVEAAPARKRSRR